MWIHDDCLSGVDPVWENAPIGGVTLCGIMPLWRETLWRHLEVALEAESVWENLCGIFNLCGMCLSGGTYALVALSTICSILDRALILSYTFFGLRATFSRFITS